MMAYILDAAAPVPPTPSASVVSVEGNGDKKLRLTWNKTVHNGRYHVEQLDRSGNWFKLGTVQSNDAIQQFDLPDALPTVTEDGDPLYFRFRITVESSGGRISVADAPITVAMANL